MTARHVQYIYEREKRTILGTSWYALCRFDTCAYPRPQGQVEKGNKDHHPTAKAQDGLLGWEEEQPQWAWLMALRPGRSCPRLAFTMQLCNLSPSPRETHTHRTDCQRPQTRAQGPDEVHMLLSTDDTASSRVLRVLGHRHAISTLPPYLGAASVWSMDVIGLPTRREP